MDKKASRNQEETMRWTKFTIDTTEETEDLVSGVLFDEGITNIEIEDLLLGLL